MKTKKYLCKLGKSGNGRRIVNPDMVDPTVYSRAACDHLGLVSPVFNLVSNGNGHAGHTLVVVDCRLSRVEGNGARSPTGSRIEIWELSDLKDGYSSIPVAANAVSLVFSDQTSGWVGVIQINGMSMWSPPHENASHHPHTCMWIRNPRSPPS